MTEEPEQPCSVFGAWNKRGENRRDNNIRKAQFIPEDERDTTYRGADEGCHMILDEINILVILV